MMKRNLPILLASSSRYRKALLSRIIPEYSTASPDIDERRKPDENFEQLALRLAKEKARALAKQYPNHLIIGSDQVACLTNNSQRIQLEKPGSRLACREQLLQAQGNTVFFYTGLCVYNTQTQREQASVEVYETKFRTLTEKQIDNYIDREPALDCAGGFKMEGLGIALFEYIRGDDPNTLIGLPLIKLISMLEQEGVSIL